MFMNTNYRPGGDQGNGPNEKKFMKKLGGKVNFGVLSSKVDDIWAKKGKTASFSC